MKAFPAPVVAGMARRRSKGAMTILLTILHYVLALGAAAFILLIGAACFGGLARFGGGTR